MARKMGLNVVYQTGSKAEQIESYRKRMRTH